MPSHCEALGSTLCATKTKEGKGPDWVMKKRLVLSSLVLNSSLTHGSYFHKLSLEIEFHS